MPESGVTIGLEDDTRALLGENERSPSATHEQFIKQFPFLESPRSELANLLRRSDTYVQQLVVATENPVFGNQNILDSIRQVLQGKDVNNQVETSFGQPTGVYKDFDNGKGFVDVLESASEDERRLILFNMLVKLVGLPLKNPGSEYDFNSRLAFFTSFINSAELRMTNINTLNGSYVEQLNRVIGTFLGGIAMATESGGQNNTLLDRARLAFHDSVPPAKDEQAKNIAAYQVDMKKRVSV